MPANSNRQFARREDLQLDKREFAMLSRLHTPQAIQSFLNAIPANHEIGGETILSVRRVLKERRAHCIEGAFVAACALWIHGRPPLLVHLDCASNDFPHLIVPFKNGVGWGAISKTNGASLRYRDPVYRSLRELAMSYFHEYCDKLGRKTLRSYSVPYDMRRMDPRLWITSERSCWEAHDRLAALRHYPLVSTAQERLLQPRSPFERRVGKLVQHPRPSPAE